MIADLCHRVAAYPREPRRIAPRRIARKPRPPAPTGRSSAAPDCLPPHRPAINPLGRSCGDTAPSGNPVEIRPAVTTGMSWPNRRLRDSNCGTGILPPLAFRHTSRRSLAREIRRCPTSTTQRAGPGGPRQSPALAARCPMERQTMARPPRPAGFALTQISSGGEDRPRPVRGGQTAPLSSAPASPDRRKKERGPSAPSWPCRPIHPRGYLGQSETSRAPAAIAAPWLRLGRRWRAAGGAGASSGWVGPRRSSCPAPRGKPVSRRGCPAPRRRAPRRHRRCGSRGRHRPARPGPGGHGRPGLRPPPARR